MARFSQPQDPLFQALNSSISFDWRLAPYDLEQSLAHARMLARSGIISDDDLREIERGLGEVRKEVEADRFQIKPDDEDVHMAIERRLTEIVGEAGAKLHTARSRNDQVATDVAMLVRAHTLEAHDLLTGLMRTLVELAERHLDWPMPGYTHLQRAQPVYLSQHLLAYFWKFRRDLQRFNFCMNATDDLPLGAGALAGVNFDTSRMFVAQELGFGGIAENSLDAVSNRDFVLDYLSAAATCATHLSQLGCRDRHLVERGVRLLRGVRPLRLRLQPHAPEEEPGRRRAAAREGAARGGPPHDDPRRAPRAAAHLQQGSPGGQGAAVRRRGHRRAVPAGGRRDAGEHLLRRRAHGRRGHRRGCSPPPTSPTCS